MEEGGTTGLEPRCRRGRIRQEEGYMGIKYRRKGRGEMIPGCHGNDLLFKLKEEKEEVIEA